MTDSPIISFRVLILRNDNSLVGSQDVLVNSAGVDVARAAATRLGEHLIANRHPDCHALVLARRSGEPELVPAPPPPPPPAPPPRKERRLTKRKLRKLERQIVKRRQGVFLPHRPDRIRDAPSPMFENVVRAIEDFS